MSKQFWTMAVAVAFLGLVFGPTGCGGAASGDHPGRGNLVSVEPEMREVTIDHEDIPGFMKGMTMTFSVAPGVALEGLGEGTEIHFRVKERGGSYIVTEIARSDS